MKTLSVLLSGAILSAGTLFGADSSSAVHNYLDKCTRCHGDTGNGNTPLGKKLHCKDYSSKKAQSLFTDEEALALIRSGKVTDGKQTMPSYKDELTEPEQKALVAYVRALAKNP